MIYLWCIFMLCDVVYCLFNTCCSLIVHWNRNADFVNIWMVQWVSDNKTVSAMDFATHWSWNEMAATLQMTFQINFLVRKLLRFSQNVT